LLFPTVYEDLPALSVDKTLLVYQHATRTGSFEEQLEARMEDLGDRLGLPQESLLAMRWRCVSPRAFIFALADPNRELVVERLGGHASRPLGRALRAAGLFERA
jgi:hypothetical protein